VENCFSVERRMVYQIYISRRPRDAVAAVYRYLSAAPENEVVRVYAVGGDGILFDCLNGMVGFPNGELTSVPYGSANDFVRSFGEGAVPAFRDIAGLSAAPARPVDIIHCGANFAMLEVNIGLIGKTVINANEILRGTLPPWLRRFTPTIYTLSALKAIARDSVIKQSYTIDMDGKDLSGSYTNIHIANIALDGGAFVPSPYARPNDGALNAIFMRSCSRTDIIKVINARNAGKYEKYDAFSHHTCKTMTINSDAPLNVNLDGESFYAKSFKLYIIPNGIRFFAPEGMDFADFSHLAYRRKADA
jgi:diacylglycerol kinase family enzyme